MVVHFMEKSDLILGVGCSFTRIHHGMDLFDDKVLVHVTNSPDDVNKDYSPDHVIIGDAYLVLEDLITEIKNLMATNSGYKFDFRDEIDKVRRNWFDYWMPRLTSDETPVSPYRVIWELMQNTDPAQTIVTHDSGSPRDQTIPFYEATNPNGFIAWGKSTQLGYSLGLAMGARMAEPKKICVNVIGLSLIHI